MDLGLRGARALVGGGSQGLGWAIGQALAGEGARVALAARDRDRVEARAAELGGFAIATNLGTADGPAHAVDAAVEAFGGLDLLLVNSGGPPLGRFDDVDESAWAAAIEGTLQVALRLIRQALPHLRNGRGPSILVVLSSSVREPVPGLVTSNTIRPGLVGLIKTLTDEIAPVRINGLAPGRIATSRVAHLDERRASETGKPVEEVRRELIARIPLGRYGEPAEVGRVGAFLLSPAASFVSGAIVPVDGGMIRALP